MNQNVKTKEIIKKYNIRLTKSLGQNFLIDYGVVKRIVDAADVQEDELVIEIGPGIGSMTRELAMRAGKVVAIEIDRHLIPALTESVSDLANVEIIHQDIMKVDIREMLQEQKNTGYRTVKVVANLPYYITTPIIMKLLEEDPGIGSMVFMIQKEVAQRMVAKPGGKDYGALSVAVQYYSYPKKVFDVYPHAFVPQPEVDSTVIRLETHEVPPVKLKNKEVFFKTVKASFGQRRKTLVNALANSGCFIESKEQIKNILEDLGIGANQRGETLTMSQFAQLANVFASNNE